MLDFKCHVSDFLFHRGVPMILDRIIGTTFKNLCYISPFVALSLVRDEKNQFFLKAPGILLNLWVQMIVPSLSALFTDSSW